MGIYNSFLAPKPFIANRGGQCKGKGNCGSQRKKHDCSHPDSQFTKFKDELAEGKIKAVKIGYTNDKLSEAIVTLKDGKKEKLILPINKEIIKDLEDNDVLYRYENKKPPAGEKLAKFGKLMASESLAPVIALSAMGGIGMLGYNAFNRIRKLMGYNNALEAAPDLSLAHKQQADDVYSTLRDSIKIKNDKGEVVEEIHTGLKKAIDTGQGLLTSTSDKPSRIFFMEGKPGTGKTFFSNLFFKLGDFEKKNNILSVNASQENASTIMNMLQDLVAGKDSGAILKQMDRQFKGNGEVKTLKIMADEITNPAFSDLTNPDLLKTVLQDNLMIPFKKATGKTYAAMGAAAAIGGAALKLVHGKAKKKADTDKTELYSAKNLSIFGGIAAATIGLVALARHFTLQKAQRQMKVLFYMTGNSKPAAFKDDAVLRRMITFKMNHVSPEVVKKQLTDTLAEFRKDGFKTFRGPNIPLEMKYKDIDKVINKVITLEGISGKVNAATLGDSVFKNGLASSITSIAQEKKLAVIKDPKDLAVAIAQTLNDTGQIPEKITEIMDEKVYQIGKSLNTVEEVASKVLHGAGAV